MYGHGRVVAGVGMDELLHEDGENEEDCWCRPDMIFDWHGREIWVHHGNGEELPPAWIIAEAIADVIADR